MTETAEPTPPRQVGTVEMLIPRLYPTTGGHRSGDHLTPAEEALVEPGTYPIMITADRKLYWELTGRAVKFAKTQDLGGGMFAMERGIFPEGPALTFPGPAYSAEEVLSFLADPEMTSRVKITITDDLLA